MTNFIVSYDLNGPSPSHKQVDDLLYDLGADRGRILETVWYVGWSGTRQQLFQALNALMSRNDQLLVAEAVGMTWRNLLVADAELKSAWARNDPT